uniref:THAP domain-containing protein 1 n=1 Tax=Acanthochromis polyacanthus TaxID=80966 RepID=A0A3Q1GQ91_9TELE
MTETCSVFGCKADKEIVSLHVLPKDVNIRMKWVHFIWKNRNIPTKLPDRTRVCSSHFPETCFENFIQKQMGFATKLILKPDALSHLTLRHRRSQGVSSVASIYLL